jgi:hypothetical protein
MVTVARELEARGAHAIVQSICQADFRPALDAILLTLARALEPRCR